MGNIKDKRKFKRKVEQSNPTNPTANTRFDQGSTEQEINLKTPLKNPAFLRRVFIWAESG